MNAAELIALLEQLPAHAEVHIEGDEFVPPRLNVFVAGQAICLLDPNHGMVDHVNGRILW